MQHDQGGLKHLGLVQVVALAVGECSMQQVCGLEREGGLHVSWLLGVPVTASFSPLASMAQVVCVL